jgi:alanine dehydrogenase
MNLMNIGVPTELKADEYRIAITPAGVRELTKAGHSVFIQSQAGMGSSITDSDLRSQGATIVADLESVYAQAQLILGVKEPQPVAVKLLQEQHTLFTYLHLAPAAQLTKELCKTGATCIAYETVVDEYGQLPLLTPMSEIAGKLASQAGAHVLEAPQGGRGMLLGGVPGVIGGNVVVIGGGIVGMNAAKIALGMEANVYLLDRSLTRLRELELLFEGRVTTLFASTLAIEELLPDADLIIGAVLVQGARAPFVITREQLSLLHDRAVLVDVSIDQGGCFETSRPTTHSDPTFVVDGIIHYCVANMPGAVPVTSTYALGNATLPYILDLAEKGTRRAIEEDQGLRAGVNIMSGKITHRAVAEGVGMNFTSVESLLK